MDQTSQSRPVVVVAGASGDLGRRIGAALVAQGADVRALVRPGKSSEDPAASPNFINTKVDYDQKAALARACDGAVCVVSALNGLEPVILGVQGRLLQAAVAAGVPRFIPSDYSLDFTKTQPACNRNLDLRRAFWREVDRAPIKATSILNGAFADLLSGGAPIILQRLKKVLYWGDAGQAFDVTTKEDVARYTARAALDETAPRVLRIAGDVVTPRSLAAIAGERRGEPFGLLRAGGIGRLSAIISVVRALSPPSDSPFPVWQGLQYLRDMSSGRGKLQPLDNDRYGPLPWTTARDVLQQVR